MRNGARGEFETNEYDDKGGRVGKKVEVKGEFETDEDENKGGRVGKKVEVKGENEVNEEDEKGERGNDYYVERDASEANEDVEYHRDVFVRSGGSGDEMLKDMDLGRKQLQDNIIMTSDFESNISCPAQLVSYWNGYIVQSRQKPA